MKTKGGKDKVNVVTLGCAKNIVDSEVLITQLRGNNIDVKHESKVDNANVIVINTCGFIDHAKQESVDTILRYAHAKEEGMMINAMFSQMENLSVQTKSSHLNSSLMGIKFQILKIMIVWKAIVF